MMPRIYIPDQVHLRSGRIVPRGHRDAELLGDGRAVIRVKRFLLGDTLKRYNEDLQERWTRPAAGDTAGIVLLSHEYERAGAPIEHPIDTLQSS
jgi:hypothetical protein